MFLQVGASTPGEELRRRQNDRDLRLDVLKTAEFALADVSLVGGHAAGIVRIVRNEIGAEIGERTTHLACMLLVHAEDDRLREAIGLREEMREMARDRFGARAQRDDALEILGVILIVGNLAPEAVEFALARPPPGGVIVRDDAVHAIGRQEAVRDALRQRVGIERRAEIGVGVPVIIPERRRRHAELIGRLEIVQNVSPVAVVARAAAVALIDDDQVEEVRRIFPIQTRPSFVAGDGLVDREIDVAAMADFAILDLEPRVAKWRKGLGHRVVDENVAIGEEQDFGFAGVAALVPTGSPQPPSDLECHRGLAGACA